MKRNADGHGIPDTLQDVSGEIEVKCIATQDGYSGATKTHIHI